MVLFHVTANADWSNLPLSGLFVDMLRRVTALAGAPSDVNSRMTAASTTGTPTMSPMKIVRRDQSISPSERSKTRQKVFQTSEICDQHRNIFCH